MYSDVGIYDRVVIQDILKEVAQTQQVDLNAKKRFKGVAPSLQLFLPLEFIYSSSRGDK